MKGTSSMTRRKEWGNTFGKMDESMMECGSKVNNMVGEATLKMVRKK